MWLTFFGLLLPVAAAVWWIFVQAYTVSKIPGEMAEIKAAQSVEAKAREEQTRKEQETEDEVKAALSLLKTHGAKLDALSEAMGLPVGANSLASHPSLAYKPSKNENSSQP